MKIEKDYLNHVAESMLCSATRNNRCLFNVGRQIGTTTFLINYAAKWFSKNKKSVVMHFDKQSNAINCWKKIADALYESNIGNEIRPNKREHVFKTNDPTAIFVVAYGEVNGQTCLRGAPYANNVGLYVVDNADFFDWFPTYNQIRVLNQNTENIVTSCPKPFDGKWTEFKKIIVSNDESWAIKTYSAPVVPADKQGLSEAMFNCEFKNYTNFFDEMKLLYKNLGNFLFLNKNTIINYVNSSKKQENGSNANFKF